MQDIKQKIISVLKEKGSELPTSEIMLSISDRYKKLKEEERYSEARQLHRKILYHINRLVREKIIRFEKYGEFGEKFFILNIGEGEEICEIAPSRYKKKIIGDQSIIPAMPIEGYEQEGIVMKYDSGSWLSRFNSVVVRCEEITDQKELLNLIKKLFDAVNDSICLDNFELRINEESLDNFLEKLNKDIKHYGKKISCTINISRADKDKLMKTLEKLFNLKTENIEFIYNISKNDNKLFVGEILSEYARNKKKIYIKNKDKCKSPWFIGKAGIYNFDENEWISQEKSRCVACSQSAVIVDVRKFYENHGFNIRKFTELLMNISKSFLSINPMQRKKLRSYFMEGIHSNKPHEQDFLELSRNYIRFWNFGLLQPNIDQETVSNIVEKARSRIDEFCRVEDRIYKSCGMSIRFKIALSSAFKKSEQGLSQAKYKKIEITGVKDLKEDKISNEIKEIKKVSRLFNGGNKISFDRIGSSSNRDLVNEIFFILDEFRLRFFVYDFKENGN